MTEGHGVYECFNCGARAVAWQADYDFEDYGIIDRQGIVHVLECQNCGAFIEYYITTEEDDETD